MLEQYIRLINYCNGKEFFSSAEFSMLSKNYTDCYKKLDYQQQGELSQAIRNYYKEET